MLQKGKFGHHWVLVYDATMRTMKRVFTLSAAVLLTQCQSAAAIDDALTAYASGIDYSRR
jgi:hypothetical protein